jgi:hypothetical protein
MLIEFPLQNLLLAIFIKLRLFFRSGWPPCKNNFYIVFLSKTLYIASVYQPVNWYRKGLKYNTHEVNKFSRMRG